MKKKKEEDDRFPKSNATCCNQRLQRSNVSVLPLTVPFEVLLLLVAMQIASVAFEYPSHVRK